MSDTREAFEKWAVSKGYDTAPSFGVLTTYQDQDTEDAWEGYQAGVAAAEAKLREAAEIPLAMPPEEFALKNRLRDKEHAVLVAENRDLSAKLREGRVELPEKQQSYICDVCYKRILRTQEISAADSLLCPNCNKKYSPSPECEPDVRKELVRLNVQAIDEAQEKPKEPVRG